MAIDIKNLVQLIQKKEHAVTSSTSVEDMINILKAAQKAEGSLIRSYDSAGDLPDAATTNERIAYLSDTRTLRFNNGTWDNPLLGAAAVAPYTIQGTVSGYTSGGAPVNAIDVIQKYSFSSDGNSSDVGDLTLARRDLAGQSSSDNGYTTGGHTGPPGAPSNVIDKFPFSTDANATDVGDLTQNIKEQTGQSSTTHGYASGGYAPPPASPNDVNVIEKFSFSVDGNATDVGDLTVGRRSRPAGQTSSSYGYTSGGFGFGVGFPPGRYNTIDKFPFSTDANATDVGDLTALRSGLAGQSSSENGYTSGGNTNNIIDKFPFSSDANATDVGDLTNSPNDPSGQSSTASGYTAGGYSIPTTSYLNVIDKFPFATDANAADVGDLLSTVYKTAGQQV